MTSEGFACPDCGRAVTTEEDQANVLSNSNGWICPECGFSVESTTGSGYSTI